MELLEFEIMVADVVEEIFGSVERIISVVESSVEEVSNCVVLLAVVVFEDLFCVVIVRPDIFALVEVKSTVASVEVVLTSVVDVVVVVVVVVVDFLVFVIGFVKVVEICPHGAILHGKYRTISSGQGLPIPVGCDRTDRLSVT